MLFGGGNQHAPETSALALRIHCQHAEITSPTANLHIYRSEHIAPGIAAHKKIAFFHHCFQTFFVGTSALEKSFDSECGVDDAKHCGNIALACAAKNWGISHNSSAVTAKKNFVSLTSSKEDFSRLQERALSGALTCKFFVIVHCTKAMFLLNKHAVITHI